MTPALTEFMSQRRQSIIVFFQAALIIYQRPRFQIDHLHLTL